MLNYLQFSIGPSGDFNNHVQDGFFSIGVKRDIVERRNDFSILFYCPFIKIFFVKKTFDQQTLHCKWPSRSSNFELTKENTVFQSVGSANNTGFVIRSSHFGWISASSSSKAWHWARRWVSREEGGGGCWCPRTKGSWCKCSSSR